jgi:nucleoside-diphosphate-sugar epimerase
MGGDSRIFVFGATGRIGPAIVAHLQRRFVVTVFSRSTDFTLSPPHEVIQCDLGDPESTSLVVQQCIGAASNISATHLGVLYMATEGINEVSRGGIQDEFTIAVNGLDVVLAAVARHSRASRRVSVVFTSSLAVDTFPTASLGYGVGKAAAEQYCRYMARHPPGPAWRFNVLRIGRVSLAPELASAVAKLAEFLLDDSSLGISGQVFAASSPTSE